MRTVALIEIGNDGHRETYMYNFIRALLDLDCRVVCLIPDPAPIRQRILDSDPGRAEKVVFEPLPFYRDKFAWAGKWQERLNVWYNWYHADRKIGDLEKTTQTRITLAFLNYLDPYLINFTPGWFFRWLFPRTWAGLFCFPATLRLQPELLRQTPRLRDRDYLISTTRCRAIAFHDEALADDLSKRLGKPVLMFPEIADLSEPDPQQPLARQIRELARGRTVLGNIGLEKHKGNYALMKLARIADPADYFFVFTGRDDGTLFDFLDQAQAEELRQFIANLPENCLWQPAHFRDEAEYNAVLSSFDVLYMCYTHFYGSSNRLTKAVHFSKPVIADAQYSIGHTVRKYQLGVAVDNSRPDTLLAALDRVRGCITRGEYPMDTWRRYLEENSREALVERFRELLELT